MTFGEGDENSFMYKVGADEATSHQILDRAVELGINFIDTADVYGPDGLSERVLGNWLAARGHRDQLVIASKFRFTMGTGPNKNGASRYRIIKCCEDSLRRLRTDRMDLYQIHMQDNATPEEETLRALDDLVRAGKIVYAGCSNYAAYRLVDSLWKARSAHGTAFVTLQAQYSLVARDLEREHIPLCREFGLGILPWSPLAAGFLSGKYRRGDQPPEGTRLAQWKERFGRYDTERNWAILGVATALAGETGTSVAEVALAWLLARPTVSSVIFGARSVAQVDENVRATALRLSAEQSKRLDDVSDFDLGYPYQFLKQIQDRW